MSTTRVTAGSSDAHAAWQRAVQWVHKRCSARWTRHGANLDADTVHGPPALAAAMHHVAAAGAIGRHKGVPITRIGILWQDLRLRLRHRLRHGR